MARRKQDEARLNFVRKQSCLVLHDECSVHIEAHHVWNSISGGVGMKPPADRTVPLCQAAHEEFHRIGKQSFEAKYGLDLEAHIERINAEYARQAKPKREKKPPPERIAVTVNNCSRCGGTHKFPVKDGLSKNVGFFKDSERRVKMKFFCKGWIGK